MVPSISSPDIEAYRLMRAGRFPEALAFAERAVAGKRVCLTAHGMLASILIRLGRTPEAATVISRAAELETGVADAYDGLGYVSLALGWHERANGFYRRATEISPQTPRFWYNLACSERSLGRLAEAEAACDRSIALDATQFPSYLLRSELRVQAPHFNHVDDLERQLARHIRDDRGRMFLGYALAKELDDLQRFDEAFQWFTRAAQARRSHLQYDISVDEQKLRRIAEAYPCVGTGANAGVGVDSSQYVFIVGLPRSGTTLVERILSGLPGVRSNGETENFSTSLLAAASPGAGDVFQRAGAADAATVAAGYARLANVHGATDKIIEKLPMNYLYVGAIHRALPDAKILALRRSPLDSCFAMYRTLFGEAYPFSYDVEELARYYAAYDRLMNHWRQALGSQLLEIVYEDLVKEPHRVGAAIAAHCGMRWSDDAIDIQRNASVSLTASAAQVRRPIYGTSSGRWRHYHRHLGPLIGALRRHGVSLPPDA
jgi:tetratricopeptide (TPR) repeat protein